MRYIQLTTNRNRQPKWKKFIPKQLNLLLGVLIFLVAGYLLLHLNHSTGTFLNQMTMFKPPEQLNILLLGNGGGTHDGADLTDTVMVAMIDPQTKKITLISIPRDLWLPDIKGKVNSVYEIGKSQGDGLNYAKQKIGQILGIPIQHSIRIDFNGFVQAIDQIGGVDVDVQQSFDDYDYPITGKEDDLCGYTEKEIDATGSGQQTVLVSPTGQIATDAAEEDQGFQYFTCRYEHLHFDAGLQHMDGTTALKFVRSRHGTNGEGSDFARAKRQQLILEAVKAKSLSLSTLLNPAKVTGVINALGKSIETDFAVTDMISTYNQVKDVKQIQSFVLGSEINNPLLIHPTQGVYGSWVLIPVAGDGNFTQVQYFVQDVLKGDMKDATAAARTRNN